MEDGDEDPQPVRAVGDVPEHGQLAVRRGGEPRLPVARDPDRTEARVAQLLERRARVADGVVDGADEERLVVAAAAGERQRREGESERSANGLLARTTGLAGRVACTKETESR